MGNIVKIVFLCVGLVCCITFFTRFYDRNIAPNQKEIKEIKKCKRVDLTKNKVVPISFHTKQKESVSSKSDYTSLNMPNNDKIYKCAVMMTYAQRMSLKKSKALKQVCTNQKILSALEKLLK